MPIALCLPELRLLSSPKGRTGSDAIRFLSSNCGAGAGAGGGRRIMNPQQLRLKEGRKEIKSSIGHSQLVY